MAVTNGPPSGFGKGVNDYLNDYVKLADAKATAFLAANLAAATLALRIAPESLFPLACRWLSLLSFAGSTFFCAWVVFPRLPKGHFGVVFWEDILLYESNERYRHELGSMDAAAVESEYAAQNRYVSKVVHAKLLAVRRAIILFFISVGLAVVSFLALP
jgi:hypothetical protein